MAGCFKAYVNNKDVITIVSYDNCDVFSINGENIYATLLRHENNTNIFKAKYPIEFGKEYIIKDMSGNETTILMNLVTKDAFFDDLFYYNKNDLGVTYHKEASTFKVWAPIATSCKLKYILNNKSFYQPMEREAHGVFKTTVAKDLKNALYCYLITNNGVEEAVCDIYSYSCNANAEYSAVIDLEAIKIEDSYPLNEVKHLNDAIIYECSIRDFSSSLAINEKGKFLGFIKSGLKSSQNHPIGFDYLKNLGITHVQLMPVTDFGSVNELVSEKEYNWGYDPTSYNHLEGSYSSSPSNPYIRIKEFKQCIAALHQNNLRVCLDMVFNHTYKTWNSIFNKLVPNYYYLMDNEGNLSNGSFCGNDLDTTKKMVKKHIVDMCVRLVSYYKIDGFRLDLMGILTIDTVKEIYYACKKINSSFILYGEGWNMPSMLKDEQKASLVNSDSLREVGFFNDTFRETMCGKNNEYDLEKKGYLNGNTFNTYHAVRAMRGCVETGCYFTTSSQSINYIECHDNATLYDKLLISNTQESKENRNKILLTALASIIFAQGVPFLQCGMEFGRSKNGVVNSYNAGDSINTIHWDLVDTYAGNVKALQDFISLRKEFSCFHLIDKETILNCIDGAILDNSIMKLTYAYDGKVCMLIFNPLNKKYSLSFEAEYKRIATEEGKVKDESLYSQYVLKPFSFTMFTK